MHQLRCNFLLPVCRWQIVTCLVAAYIISIDALASADNSRSVRPLVPCGKGQTHSLNHSCTWATDAATAGPVKVASAWPTASGALPVLHVSGQAAAAAPLQGTGFELTLQRLVLVNVSLSDPDTPGVLKLWPLGLYNATGSGLALWDVRLVIGEVEFQQYLRFFNSPEGQHFFRSPADAPHKLYTDGQSFMHIPEWEDAATLLRSVSLVSGPCTPEQAAAYLASAESAAAAAAAAGSNGCNVHTVDDATLVPTLLEDAAVATPDPLLVLIVSNVSLGQGLRAGAINILRPTLMVGLWTVPTSVDLGMVVNQLNVTREYSDVFWQSVILENAAPGDAVSSMMAAPYSAAVSANIWAMQCDVGAGLLQETVTERSRARNCLNLHNTTTVLASQKEMDYVMFMYSMFNSPLPNMRQHTEFYHTELNCTVLDMGPGPNGYGMTVYNMSCSAWKLRNGVYTTQPVVSVAPRLPFPVWGPKIGQSTQAAPWVEAVSSCSNLQAAMQAPSEENRLHVWMLLNNISIVPPGDPACWHYRDVKYTTQIFGQVHDSPDAQLQQAQQQQENASAPLDVTQRDGIGFDVFALDFGHMRSALQLPQNAQEKFLQIQNLTLMGLPQGPLAHTAAGMRTGPGGDGPTPPDIWTLLLWSVNRTQPGSAVYMADVQLILPPQEWQFVADTARSAASFVVQLSGTRGLAFTSVSVADNAVRVASLQGPGISGSNVWLLSSPSAAAGMPDPYVWPLSVIAAPTSSSLGGDVAGPRSAAVQAAVGASIGGGVLLAVLGWLCWWCLRRRKRQQQQQQQYAAYADYKQQHSSQGSVARHSSSDGAGTTCPGPCVSIDVGTPAADANSCCADDGQLPLAAAIQDAKLRPCSSARDVALLLSGERTAAVHSLRKDGPGSPSQSGASDQDNTVASGLQRWKAAISMTTLQLMERRVQSLHATPPSTEGSNRLPPSAGGATAGTARASSASGRLLPAAVAAAAAAGGSGGRQPAPPPVQPPLSLQLQGLIGQGSFGCVYLGLWHGKRVAVKVMQLPANALMDVQDQEQDAQLSSAEERRRRCAKALQQNSPPHMAIMETVVSSTMSHPNVVTVYTYKLNPLTVDEAAAAGSEGDAAQQQQQHDAAGGMHGSVSGWELKLVMEYCDSGTLRDALDRRTLIRADGATYLPPAVALSLAHDVAAALLHLHSEGVVHGDLKAANVLLTRGGEDVGGVWAATLGYKVTAKVADFGLALSLDPNDTHATMAARGTPTHMSPELFMSGRVSKASDVYAFGILLYEMATGRRAYAGVPVPLLPHEVARQGLRPIWPADLPAGCRDLQRLAEACWAQQPLDRPSLQEVFSFLECCQTGKSPPPLSYKQQQQQQHFELSERCAAQHMHPGLAVLVKEPQQPQQQQQQQPTTKQQLQALLATHGGRGVRQHPTAKGGLSWSEVSYEGMQR